MSFLKSALLAASAFAIVFGSYLTTTTVSEAHERRAVGSYTFVVGFLTEPALLNEPNSLDLRISKTEDASPVTGLNTTLKFAVTANGKTTEVPIAARFNTPGAYNAYFMPTFEGEYSFRIYGTIEGNNVDEKFTSGPGTFSSVAAPNAFPNAIDEASEDTNEFEARILALESDDGGSDSGTLFGIIGIIVGAAGLLVGGIALSRSGKAA